MRPSARRGTVRALKWSGIAAATIIGLIALGVAGVYAVSSAQLGKRYVDHVPPVAVGHDSASIARGSHLMHAVLPCAECHGEDLGGKVLIDRPFMAVLSAPNLTRAGLGSQLSDADFVRAIRYGVAPDGRSLLVMPSAVFYYLSDSDLAAVVAYVKSAPAASHPLKPTTVGPLARALLVAGKLHPERASMNLAAERPQPAPAVSAAYGKYLVKIATCRHCHGPSLAGGPPADNPNAPPAANITPEGIGRWTEADFRTALAEGKRPDGSRLNPFMPVRMYRNMTNDEIAAIWTYLKTVPPKPYGTR